MLELHKRKIPTFYGILLAEKAEKCFSPKNNCGYAALERQRKPSIVSFAERKLWFNMGVSKKSESWKIILIFTQVHGIKGDKTVILIEKTKNISRYTAS